MTTLQHLVVGLRIVAEFTGWCVIVLSIAAALTVVRSPEPFREEGE